MQCHSVAISHEHVIVRFLKNDIPIPHFQWLVTQPCNVFKWSLRSFISFCMLIVKCIFFCTVHVRPASRGWATGKLAATPNFPNHVLVVRHNTKLQWICPTENSTSYNQLVATLWYMSTSKPNCIHPLLTWNYLN